MSTRDTRAGENGDSQPPGRASLYAALTYLVFGAAWILVSDWVVAVAAPSDVWEYRLQSAKGVAFVAVSAALVGVIVLRLLRAQGRFTDSVLRQEHLFESIVNDTPELICRFEPDGTIVHVNDAYGAYFGRNAEELAGQNLFDLIAPEERAEVEGRLKGLSLAEPIRTHGHRVMKGPEVRWQRWTNRALFDEAGRVTEIQAIGRDITAEVTAEQERNRATELLSSVMDAMPGRVMLLDADGRVRFCNRISKVKPGAMEAVFIDRDIAEFFEPESVERIREAMREALERGTDVRLATVATSGPAELDTIVFPVAGSNGDARVGLSAYDVSESIVLQHRLSRHMERVGSAFDLAGDGMAVFEIGADGTYGRPTVLNAAAERLSGYTRDELLSMEITGLLAPEELARAEADAHTLLSTGRLSGEYGFVRKDGVSVPLEVTSTYFEDDGKGFVICIVRDSTSRKAMEAQLRASEGRYRAVFAAAADGIMVFREGVIVAANPQAERMFHAGAEALIGRTPMDFSPEYQRDGERSKDKFDRIYTELYEEQAETVEFEWEHELADGTQFQAWVRMQLATIDSEPHAIAVVRDVTERTLEQRQLHDSEEALREAQTLAQIGSWSVDWKTGEVLYASEEMYRLFDTTPEAMRDVEHGMRLVHPDDRDRVLEAARDAREGRYDVEYRAIVNGEVRWMRSRAEFVRDPDSGRLIAHGTTQDVTDLKLAERKSEQAERRLASILQSVPVGIGILEGRRIAWASEGLDRITGHSAESLVGQDLGALLSAGDVARFEALRAGWDEEHRLDAMQARLLTGDSTRRWVQISVSPIDAADGLTACTFSMADITRLREAEERIRELSAAVENAPVSIMITDLDGAIRYVNPHVERVTGYTAEELIGRNPRIFKSGEMSGDEYKNLWAALSAGESWHGDFHNRRKDGELFWERATISPIFRESDRTPFRYISIKQDITQIKNAEEELRRYKNELEEMVRERTAELVEARNAALEADRLKSTFLASVSHELRTPLTSVIGFSEILKEESYGGLNEKQKEYVDYVLMSGKQLLDIINDILDLSKLDAGRMELELRQFTLPTLISHCIQNVETSTANRSIRFEEDIDQNLWLTGVVADERKIRQVLLNLLTNAVKFTPDGGSITVRATLDGGTVQMAVSDTGEGIAGEHLEDIFGTFRQLNDNQFRHSKGTGLGLTLTRRIIVLHGGQVWAESDGPGKGSTFYVEFPVDCRTVAEAHAD